MKTLWKGFPYGSADREAAEAWLNELGKQGWRLEKVRLTKDDPIHDMLEFYMGKNSYERQGFIIDNLRIEADYIEEEI